MVNVSYGKATDLQNRLTTLKLATQSSGLTLLPKLQVALTTFSRMRVDLKSSTLITTHLHCYMGVVYLLSHACTCDVHGHKYWVLQLQMLQSISETLRQKKQTNLYETLTTFLIARLMFEVFKEGIQRRKHMHSLLVNSQVICGNGPISTYFLSLEVTASSYSVNALAKIHWRIILGSSGHEVGDVTTKQLKNPLEVLLP